jgi:hypothetical protein
VVEDLLAPVPVEIADAHPPREEVIHDRGDPGDDEVPADAVEDLEPLPPDRERAAERVRLEPEHQPHVLGVGVAVEVRPPDVHDGRRLGGRCGSRNQASAARINARIARRMDNPPP